MQNVKKTTDSKLNNYSEDQKQAINYFSKWRENLIFTTNGKDWGLLVFNHRMLLTALKSC